ncbi:MAG: ABC transporter substrate-binding protein [Flavobacteriales bacterium]|nr:ABC transporter substrate-binding protein [Flavobacteriales bacterium]MBL6872760.1 ABC transporter substrate-binding protein [Flavobacteriales bacterium]
MIRPLIHYCLFICILCLSISCSDTSDDSDLSIFKYNESAGITSLDPAFAKDQANIWATNQLFNGLVQLDSNLNVQPSIARSWDVTEDALKYTFHLRNDVYFHEHSLFSSKESRKVTAHDFVYSFGRLTDKSVASPGAWVMNNVDSYEAIDDSTLRISLIQPFPPFLGLLSMSYCSVVPKIIVENTSFRDAPIGTGPFHFQFWKENVKLVFRKNTTYFEDGLPLLDAVSITFIKDKQTAFLEFLKGNIDFISGLDPSYKDEVLTSDGELRGEYIGKIQLQSLPYLNTEYLGFLMDDNNVSSTQHIEVRKAINYGFDREKMITYLRNNIGTPAVNGFIPKGLPSFSDTLMGYNYNPERSKELIRASKLEDIKVTLNTTSSYLDLCEFIQNQLSEIGISVSININPPSTHRQMVATSKLDFFRGSWIADYADAENYLALFYSKNFCPNGPNYTHFSSDKYDGYYEAAMLEVSLEKRQHYYQLMNQMIIDEAAIVPLYYDQVIRFVQNNISGFESNAMNLLQLKRVKKD